MEKTILIVLLLVSCASAETVIKKNRMIINDHSGIYIAPHSGSYIFHLKATGKIHKLHYNTCHRERLLSNAWNVKTGKVIKTMDKKQYKFKYTPNDVEKDCFMELSALEESKLRHSYGTIFFKNPKKYNLAATVTCDGFKKTHVGVSACEAKEGMTQRIEFKEPVKLNSDCYEYDFDENGKKIKPTGKVFDLTVKDKPYCTYIFPSKSGKRHKFYLKMYQRRF